MNSTELNNKPELILGTVQLGLPYGINNQTGQPSLEKSLNILWEAKKGGIDSLDTAEAYGSSLSVVSKALESGLNFKIYTKIKPEILDVENYVDGLLNRLKTTHLEGLSFHASLNEYSDKQILSLFDLKAKGLIRHLGVSLYDSSECLSICKIPEVDLVQLPYNLLDSWELRNTAIKVLKSNKKKIHTRSLFLQGMFFKKEPIETLESSILKLKKLASCWSGGLAQMAIDYARSNIYLDGVLVGAETAEQVNLNCRMWNQPNNLAPWPNIGTLNDTEIQALDPRNWK